MSVLDTINQTGKQASHSSKAYYEYSKQYYELKVFKQLAVYVTKSAKCFLYGLFLIIGTFFWALGAAIALSSYFENAAIGFLIVGGFFLIGLLLVYAFRKYLERYLVRKLSDQYFDT